MTEFNVSLQLLSLIMRRIKRYFLAQVMYVYVCATQQTHTTSLTE